ncbi:MAG: biotin--[acetyl-CoA-carboxylase] ligase [Candidatus Rokubacteria bacterium]|nr:biotin--[acetyl-CoA-carboxylase] ligase [Candidatus Rokubacteria bacterium]
MKAAGSPPPAIVRLAAVESTQAAAWELAAEGAADGSVIVADHQSAGRGRRGRAWTDAPGTSLLASILVRPALAPALWPAFSLTAAVAVAEALGRLTGLAVRLKWPNDVLVGDRKIAGILLESRVSADGGTGVSEPHRTSLRPPADRAVLAVPATIIIGIGINLAQREFPPELAGRATSVALETGQAPPRDAVLAAVLEEFGAWRRRLEGEGFAPVRARWLALADTIGRRVTVDAVSGVAVDLAPDGALLVEDHGRLRRIVAGEIAEPGPAAAGEGRADHAARR